jgi:hypothetical protein
MDLSQRDKHAIEYTKHSALVEGDTLVLIKYPNDEPVYDPSGFQLSFIHRVHSKNLIATGSKIFKEKLENEWLNHRAAKKAGVFPTLPEGIQYVIDLTPPEEGDDALELTANLSCSAGIRYWYTAQSRLGVARNLVAGKDETTVRRGSVSLPTSPMKSSSQDAIDDPQVSELSQAVTSIINGETTGIQYRGVIPDQQPGGLIGAAGASNVNRAPPDRLDGGEADQYSPNVESPVIEPTQGGLTVLGDAQYNGPILREEILDYCPIRHRAGIERLLQVIEGKEPRLDSAPKVWTLAVLAKYFDCAPVAVSLRRLY